MPMSNALQLTLVFVTFIVTLKLLSEDLIVYMYVQPIISNWLTTSKVNYHRKFWQPDSYS